jgi:CRP-like cAMP-binding protein
LELIGHAESFYHTASKLKLVTFPTGSYVFQEGEPGYDFFIILDGEVCITRKKVVLISLTNRQYFGEYALVKDFVMPSKFAC